MRLFSAIVLTICLLFTACSDSPRADKVYTSWLDNQAIGGYDLVSFYSGKPLLGNENFQVDYMDASWSFSSRANKDLFQTNPEAFLPQYGGHCAWAMAHRKLAKGSPESWYVRDGKLYFLYNQRIYDQWVQDVPGFIDIANKNWPRFRSNN